MYLGRKEIVEFLLEHNALINLKNEDGSTALHAAVSDGKFRWKKDCFKKIWPIFEPISGRGQIVQELIDNFADINAQDDEGNTPLHVALKKGNLKLNSFF